jgi:hypothetical protein
MSVFETSHCRLAFPIFRTSTPAFPFLPWRHASDVPCRGSQDFDPRSEAHAQAGDDGRTSEGSDADQYLSLRCDPKAAVGVAEKLRAARSRNRGVVGDMATPRAARCP